MIAASLAGLPPFLAYFSLTLALCAIYILVYTRLTAHDEFTLIRRNCLPAALALGMSLLGFALPLASAVAHSVSIPDCLVWGLVALVVQIGVYWLARLAVPGLSKRIEDGEMAAAVWLGCVSLAGGALNAASMII